MCSKERHQTATGPVLRSRFPSAPPSPRDRSYSVPRCSIPDQQLPNAKDHRRALNLLALHRNEAHCWTHRCFTDRLGVCRVILLPLDERLDVGQRDQSHIMAKLADLTPQKMSAATGFHRDNAKWQLLEKFQNLSSPQFLTQNCPPCAFSPIDLKYILRQIESDRDNLLHDRSPFVDPCRPTLAHRCRRGTVTSSTPIIQWSCFLKKRKHSHVRM